MTTMTDNLNIYDGKTLFFRNMAIGTLKVVGQSISLQAYDTTMLSVSPDELKLYSRATLKKEHRGNVSFTPSNEEKGRRAKAILENMKKYARA